MKVPRGMRVLIVISTEVSAANVAEKSWRQSGKDSSATLGMTGMRLERQGCDCSRGMRVLIVISTEVSAVNVAEKSWRQNGKDSSATLGMTGLCSE